MNKKLRKLTKDLFFEDCDRINLLYKLSLKEEKIEDLKSLILFELGYPDEVQIYDFPPFVLRVAPRGDIEVFTSDQYEKIEGFLNDEL